MRKLLLASVVLWTGPVMAADMNLKAPPRQLAIEHADSWAGFYLGIDGGYGWGSYKPDIPGVTIPPEFREFKAKGWAFGGHAGYNWQIVNWVVGFEVDYSSADINVTNSMVKGPSISASVDSFGSVRARAGYAISPAILIYGTGGLGLINASADFTSGNTNIHAESRTWSWVAGGGIETRLMSNWILRAEYLHYDGGKANFAFGAPFSQNVLVNGSIDVVRGGVSYKF